VRHYTFVDYSTQVYNAVVAVLILILHNGTVPFWPWLIAGHGVCLVLIHSVIVWHGRGQPSKALDLVRHFYPILLYTPFFTETGCLNRMVFPQFMDPLTIRWDQAVFGFQPSIRFMELFPYLPLSELFYGAYFSYYLMIAGVGLALFVKNRQQFFHYVSIISFVFYICYLIYIIVPIIGPRVFLEKVGGYELPAQSRSLAPDAGYPDALQRGPFFKLMGVIYSIFESPGSAIPSSHVAVALCTLFFSFRYLRPIRYWHLAATVLLCFATIYCRYHYVVDVMAGILTAVVLIPLGNWLYWKAGAEDPRQQK
jgi:membrane-associated phospholipid phosphatase